MKYDVVWTKKAEEQLTEAALYIAYNSESLETGIEFKDKVVNETKKLDILPYRGFVPRERIIANRGFRGLIIDNYVAFYKIYENKYLVSIEVFVPLKSDYKRFLL